MTRQEASIIVPSEDPEKKKDDKPKHKKEELANIDGDNKGAVNGKKQEEDELSEEDQQLKSELEMLVERLQESDVNLYKPTLETLRTLIRTSTSSMTSVPKPLKFLRPHYETFASIYESWPSSPNKNALADILSLLAMTFAEEGKRDSLKYRLLGAAEDPGLWGHEYVRHLAAEIGEEFAARQENDESSEDLMKLALEIVPFFLHHNAEADAVDLFLELEAIDRLVELVDENTYSRVCLYMVSCVNFLVPPDDVAFLRAAHAIYRKQNRFCEAMALAIRLGDQDLISSDFEDVNDPLLKKQLAFMLARSQIVINIDNEELLECLNNSKLSEQFIALGKELNIYEPKTPEDIYKSHLENVRSIGGANVDSARQNLSSSFVNAFVNAGFGNDKLMIDVEDGASWIYKNKDYGMLSATASLGMLRLWDVESGLSEVDKYTYSSEEYIKAGALLAIGIVNSGVRNESDPALAYLSEHIESSSVSLRKSAILGLGLAYAGSCREDIMELLLTTATDSDVNMEISSLACLALGLVFVGSCQGDTTSGILQSMMERTDEQLKDTWGRYMALGLALLYLGKQDACDATLETLKAIDQPLAKQAAVLVEICAFAGTGNVLKVQDMLHLCNDHIDKEKEDDLHQAYAVLGIALIGMGEDIGAEMATRQFNHLMHYGEGTIRKTVPLALALLHASNPVLSVLDTLSKYSHDNDLDVAINAIFAMGIVGAGTNNARLAQMLRQLASYYHKEPNCLFMVRISQGLVHMGKGTISINPYHTDRQLMSRVAIAGLLATILSFTDTKSFVLSNSHYLLYCLVTAMYPRFLITFDENLQNKAVTVRVGQAVDVVGQAGRPKTITGFQTHSTPVLLAHSERAELATDEYKSIAHVLEGFVILKKNEAYVEIE